MAMNEKLMGDLIKQMNNEFFNEKTYLALACYAASSKLNGFTKMFIDQAKEEHKHAMRFFHYVNMRGGRARIYPGEEPQNWFNTMSEALKFALNKEQDTSAQIYALNELALEVKDYQTAEFLQWFHKEQVEEVNTFTYLAARAEAQGSNIGALFDWDGDIDNQYENEQELADDEFSEYDSRRD